MSRLGHNVSGVIDGCGTTLAEIGEKIRVDVLFGNRFHQMRFLRDNLSIDDQTLKLTNCDDPFRQTGNVLGSHT